MQNSFPHSAMSSITVRKILININYLIVLREEVPPTVSKPVLNWFAKEKIKTLKNDSALEAGLFAIESIGANR